MTSTLPVLSTVFYSISNLLISSISLNRTSTASIVEEVNYESIYSTLQMVNGVVSTPPARLVDAIAAPGILYNFEVH